MATLKTSFGRKQNWRNEAISYLVSELTDLGQKACVDAIRKREYNNRKYNLHDSIGSAVYVDGKLVRSSRRYAESKMSTEPYKNRGANGNGEYITGRQALDAYWENHQTISATNAVELVVVAATFYAGILESNGIQVISAAADYIQDNISKYKSYNPKLKSYADLLKVV